MVRSDRKLTEPGASGARFDGQRAEGQPSGVDGVAVRSAGSLTRCGAMTHQARAMIRLRAGGRHSSAAPAASPAPATAARPIRPRCR
jgi:hypothetical protein